VALKKAKNFNYEVKETLATLSKKDNEITELRVVSYNNYKPKLDLHKWEVAEDSEKMLRGLTLTDEEARTLLEALQEYFKKPKED
jgi:hypothetical protein